MNEKAQALVDALEAVGINCHLYEPDRFGTIQIDIDHRKETERDSEWNDHFKWNVGVNKGLMILLDADGNIKEISE